MTRGTHSMQTRNVPYPIFSTLTAVLRPGRSSEASFPAALRSGSARRVSASPRPVSFPLHTGCTALRREAENRS